MKTLIKVLFIFSLFSLLGMFNVAHAAKVYVIGSPTIFPKYNETLL